MPKMLFYRSLPPERPKSNNTGSIFMIICAKLQRYECQLALDYLFWVIIQFLKDRINMSKVMSKPVLPSPLFTRKTGGVLTPAIPGVISPG